MTKMVVALPRRLVELLPAVGLEADMFAVGPVEDRNRVCQSDAELLQKQLPEAHAHRLPLVLHLNA